MSIAEKQATISENNVVIAENMQKVYEAGQDSMVDPDKIIPKSTSGNPVYLDDVSEIPHDVGITLSSDTITDFSDVSVTVCGKNLLPENEYRTEVTTNGVTFKYEGDGIYHISGTVEHPSTASASLGLTSHMFYNKKIRIEKDSRYVLCGRVLSGTVSGASTDLVPYLGIGGSSVSRKNWLNLRLLMDKDNQIQYITGVPSATLADATHIPEFWFYQTIRAGETVTYDIRVQIWLEKGSTPTDYEPYNGTTYTANADGTIDGVKLLSPYMNIYSDSDVNLFVDYRKSYGMQAEYDRFWNVFQDYGNRKGYDYAFYTPANGSGWNDGNFKPKYNFKITNGDRMFRGCYFTDFKGILERQGITFDSSEATIMHLVFQNCKYLTHVPTVDVSKCPAGYSNTIFGYCNSLHTIDKLKVRDDGATKFTEVFYACDSLKNITFEGVIGQNISFQHSPLSVKSMKNIIEHLADYSTESTGTYSITFTENCWTALEADSSAPDGGTWEEYINNKGWLT